MSSRYEPLIPATLDLNPDGTPVSVRYDDIYYAGSVPLAQAREVFVAGNGLPQRWRGRSHFTVLETGFGLGHNFLALWQAWRDDPQRCGRLHFVSIEAHPFTRADLSRLYQNLDASVQPLAQTLCHAWPVLTPGMHRLEFDGGAVTLTLAFGRVQRMLPELSPGFDACFLDGFSPRVNPDMWTPQVFRQLARLANRDATLATWCSAGQVRRDLQDAGFVIERLPGFGSKRHRIAGYLRPGLGRDVPPLAAARTVIVGGGFAGAAAAYALAARGHDTLVIDPAFAEGCAGTHRDHRGAAMTPALSRDDDIRARLSRAGVFLAELRWGGLPETARPRRCGTLHTVSPRSRDSWRHALEHLSFPPEFVRWADVGEASELTGVRQRLPGLWHGHGHLVRPESLLEGLLGSPRITRLGQRVARIGRNGDENWLLYNEEGDLLAEAGRVVVANSWLAPRLLASIPEFPVPVRLQSMRRIAGQISYFPTKGDSTLKSVLAGDGICLPDGPRGLIGGSTYVKGTTLSIMTSWGHHENRQKVMALIDDQSLRPGWPQPLADGWAGWRATVRDRRPVIGPVAAAPGFWLACGFGSRGLAWSALAAELLAATLYHEPVPLERGLLEKIAPV